MKIRNGQTVMFIDEGQLCAGVAGAQMAGMVAVNVKHAGTIVVAEHQVVSAELAKRWVSIMAGERCERSKYEQDEYVHLLLCRDTRRSLHMVADEIERKRGYRPTLKDAMLHLIVNYRVKKALCE